MEDKVVDPNKIKDFIKKWGGKTTTKIVNFQIMTINYHMC